MPIAAKNLLLEIGAVFLLIFLVLSLVSIGGRFSGYLEEVVNDRIPIDILWLVLIYRLPEFFQILIPLSLFLSVLVTLSRYHSEQEFSVLLMGGLAPGRLFVWLGSIAFPLTIIVASASMWLTPLSVTKFDVVMEEAKASDNVARFPVGEIQSMDKGKQMIFIEDIDNDRDLLSDVVFARVDEMKIQIAQAASAHISSYTNSDFKHFVLTDGIYRSLDQQSGQFEVSQFASFKHRVENEYTTPSHTSATIASKDLNLNSPEEASEFHWRIALPLLTLISTICAIGVARTTPRSGRFSCIAPGLFLFIAYISLIVVGRNLASSIPGFGVIGLYPVHASFLLLGIYLVRRSWLPA